MSETNTSDIDCNDLLNQIGLGTNENKDENNKNETKKKKKVRSNKKNQNQSTKNKQPLMNLAEFINPKNSDFQTDEDISNNKNVFDITNDENEEKSTEIKEPKAVNSQISTDFDDIRSYSSTVNENIETNSDKKIELQSPEQKTQDEVHDIENVFNIDSDSNSDDKKEEKIENTQKEETNIAEVQQEEQPKKEEEKKVDDIPKKPAKNSKKNNNKIKKNLTRINLSQYFDSQSQNSNDEFKNINKEDVDEPKKEEKKIVKENLSKFNRQTSEIERRISDYLNLSIKKVISDFTAELTTLLNQSDSFDETIRRYISDFKKNILNSIDFSQNDTTFSNSTLNSIDISPTNDFKDLYRDINDILPIKPENSMSAFAECQSKIQTTKNFLNSHISPLVSEVHNEVYKSARRTKLKVKKFKLNRQKYTVYDKLYDLEKREFEYQIESHISEIKRKGSFYTKASSPVSPSSISFFEEDSITDRMRTFSMTPTKSDLYKEIEGIIKLLKVRRKKTTASMNLNLSISSMADTSLSTSFFPISPSQIQEEFQIHEPSTSKLFFYSKIIKEIIQSREESRSLRQSFQRKIQEFCSASSLLMMEFQTQLSRQQQQQQQAFAASISLLQTNPQNYFTQTVPAAFSNETNLNTNVASNNKNSRTSALLQIANDDDIENEELLSTLRQQADEMNRKMVDELNSTTAFIKKISRSTRRHSVSHTHHRRHHRHSRIDPDPSMQKRKLELSSDISLSNMSDDNNNKVSSKIEKRKDNNISNIFDNQKLQIRKNTKNNIQDDFHIKKHQDVRRRKSSSKH